MVQEASVQLYCLSTLVNLAAVQLLVYEQWIRLYDLNTMDQGATVKMYN